MKDRTDCINCVIRLLESIESSEYTVKKIGYIFGMDASEVDRRFRKEWGMTLKAYLDQMLKNRLSEQLRRGHKYGYEHADGLGFSSNRAFYRWVRRMFGMSFSRLQKGPSRSM